MVIGVIKIFLYSSSVYTCHLLISCASVRFIPFLSFIVPIFAWNVPLVSLIFLMRSLVFHILFFSSISLHCSLRKAFLSLLAILWNSAFRWYIFPFRLCLSRLFFSQLCVGPPQTAIFPFCISFSWGWFWLPPPAQCYEPSSIVHQTLCLPDWYMFMYQCWVVMDPNHLRHVVGIQQTRTHSEWVQMQMAGQMWERRAAERRHLEEAAIISPSYCTATMWAVGLMKHSGCPRGLWTQTVCSSSSSTSCRPCDLGGVCETFLSLSFFICKMPIIRSYLTHRIIMGCKRQSMYMLSSVSI